MDKFRVIGINDPNLGPTDPFIIQLTFVSDGTFTGTVTALSDPNLPRPVTATITASDKTYDGTNTATITGCALTGVLPADVANVSCIGSSATFASANASTQPVTALVTLSGAAASNYTLGANTTATTTAKVIPKAASVTPNATSKTYGAADPVLSGTLSGFVAADGVTATYSPRQVRQ